MGKEYDFENEYGICDSRNNYSNEELKELSKKKLYYIWKYKGDDGNIYIQYKKVYGYVSEDEDSCIFIKDFEITNEDDIYYHPIKLIKYCINIKQGIYYNRMDDIIYCTTDEIDYCLDFAKKNTKKQIQSDIEDLENKIKKIKSISIKIEY